MADAVPALSIWEVILRVAVAAVLGGLVGFEREFRDQPAGFRTHILVSMGAALFTLAGAYGIEAFLQEGSEAIVRFDPTRVAAQVVTGIGFLGAGAILRQGLNVRGLTTAAALWVTAAIGVAVGLGYWAGAVATAVLTVLSLYGLKNVEQIVFPRLRKGRIEYVIAMTEQLHVAELVRLIESHRARIESMKLDAREEGTSRLVVRVGLPPHLSVEVLAEEMSRLAGVTDVDWAA